jgi:Uma2 family endonuclease
MTTALEKVQKDIEEKNFTVEEYLAFEEKALEKHEFRNGKLVTMPGGTLDHGTIALLIATAFKIALRKSGLPNRVLGGDNQIWMPKLETYVYPDAAIIGEPPAFYPEGQKKGIMNPILIVEVLSDSTEAYDRGEKFNNYSTLDSFREYVLVSQKEPKVNVHFRTEKGSDIWQIKTYSGMDASFPLQAFGAEIKLADIYEGIDFENSSEAAENK